jgi:Carboxypeptidase regulatory-like domain
VASLTGPSSQIIEGGTAPEVPYNPSTLSASEAYSRGEFRMLKRIRMNRCITRYAVLVAWLSILTPIDGLAADGEQGTKASIGGGSHSPGAQTTVLVGRVTNEAGAALAGVRVRVVAVVYPERRVIEELTGQRHPQVKSGNNGDFRLELSNITEGASAVIDATKPGYCSLRGPLMASSGAKPIELVPGGSAEASLVLRPARYFAGILVDERGEPIAGVRIDADAHRPGATKTIEKTVSNSTGSFELFNYPLTPPFLRGVEAKGRVHFYHADFLDREIEDVYLLGPKDREAMRVVLGTGYRVTGTVFDRSGKPVPNAMIKAILKDKTHRKATLTDANGKFTFRGVSGGLTVLTARALDIRQQTFLPMALKSDKNDLEVRLKSIELPTDIKTYTVLGMKIADVTSELRSIYDLFDEHGVLILDPGRDSARLRIGRLHEGYVFWMVGNSRVRSVSEFVSQILAETAGQNADECSVRVAYNFSDLESDGSRTATMRLTKSDLKHLRILSDELMPELPCFGPR